MASILVIDDDVQMREMLATFLACEGHQVATAADGRVATDLFRAAPPDLVITDLMMPNQEGIETIAWLRRAQPAVGIIAMSGQSESSQSMLRAARFLGAQQVLTKPFTLAELAHAIAAVLAWRSPPAVNDGQPAVAAR